MTTQTDEHAVLRKFHDAAQAAENKLAVGKAYFDDGALLSAARCFEQAATLMREAHAIRTEALDRPVSP